MSNKKEKKGAIAMAIGAAGLAWKGAKMINPDHRKEILDIAKDPKAWGEKLTDAWDWTVLEAGETKDAIVVLAKIALAKEVPTKDLKETAEQLGELGLVIPPLRVFMLPGSWLLLGTLSKLTPWHMMPEFHLPDLDLRGALMEKFGKGESTGFEDEAEAARDALESDE
ncbi:MAG: hypothetical protein HN696_07185 [Euryarchaeota archaeon]|jgi:hypothetical protein|nr:hypothetical protein [Euryarchaeota archaeon]